MLSKKNDQVRLTGGISEVLVYGLPVSNGFMLPVRITRGDLYWAPCVSAPRLSIARFRTRSRQRRVCACRGCSASTPLSVPPWLQRCECWAAACARMCGPGGIGPGYVSRTEERDLRRYRRSSYVTVPTRVLVGLAQGLSGGGVLRGCSIDKDASTHRSLVR